MKFLRILFGIGVVYCIWLIFAYSFTTALLSFLALGAVVYVGAIMVEAFQALTKRLSRPSEDEREYHVDPTMPDEKEHPLIVLFNGRRIKK